MACAGATTLRIELERLTGPAPKFDLTANRVLELAKSVYSVYQEQGAAEQRRLLDTVLSNCTFDRGTLAPAWIKPFDLFVEGNRTGDWRGGRGSDPGWDAQRSSVASRRGSAPNSACAWTRWRETACSITGRVRFQLPLPSR